MKGKNQQPRIPYSAVLLFRFKGETAKLALQEMLKGLLWAEKKRCTYKCEHYERKFLIGEGKYTTKVDQPLISQ